MKNLFKLFHCYELKDWCRLNPHSSSILPTKISFTTRNIYLVIREIVLPRRTTMGVNFFSLIDK